MGVSVSTGIWSSNRHFWNVGLNISIVWAMTALKVEEMLLSVYGTSLHNVRSQRQIFLSATVIISKSRQLRVS